MAWTGLAYFYDDYDEEALVKVERGDELWNNIERHEQTTVDHYAQHGESFQDVLLNKAQVS